ncbi:hypothetical protein OSK54_03745, partial [Escherichia coli]|nr:hypothetical protein [Escherichia coli]
ADRNRSHWSTSKTPSYTKSVSWQHHRNSYKEKYNYVIYWQIELTGGRNLRVRKVSNNNPLHQQTSNRVPRYAGNTRRLNWRMV